MSAVSKSLLLQEIDLIIKAFLLLIVEMFSIMIFGDRRILPVPCEWSLISYLRLALCPLTRDPLSQFWFAIGSDNNKHPTVNRIVNATSELQRIQECSSAADL